MANPITTNGGAEPSGSCPPLIYIPPGLPMSQRIIFKTLARLRCPDSEIVDMQPTAGEVTTAVVAAVAEPVIEEGKRALGAVAIVAGVALGIAIIGGAGYLYITSR